MAITGVVDVLGTRYTIIRETLEENSDFEKCDGYCDPSTKELYVRQYEDKEVKNLGTPVYRARELLQNKVLRHEIVHAFMYESGLWRNGYAVDVPWCMNEEMVDWIAIQGPKLYKAWEEAGAL